MNGLQGLPGFEVILREHKRLASKLTTDECKAIKNYIEHRISQDHADIQFRLYALQNDYDVTVRRSSETITELYQELSEKKEIIKHYQNSDQNIGAVYKQKQVRWEKKQELLMSEIEKIEGEAKRATIKLKQVEEELDSKTKDVISLEEKLDEANKAIEMVEEARTVLAERDEKQNEMLKRKNEIDKLERIIQTNEREIHALKGNIARFNRDEKFNEMKVTSMQDELRKQVAEVAVKCKDLSELQFKLQMEKRQTETLQNQLRHASTDVQNYKKLLDDSRPPLDPRDPVVITLKKDFDIMDIRIRSLDIIIRLRTDEIKKIADRLDDIKEEELLANQIKGEIYLQGDTFLELAATELAKKLNFKHQRLQEELKYARDWELAHRDADMLRSEIAALMKQASICKVTDLSNRAAKQLQRIELIMRGTVDDIKMPKIYKVSERTNSENKFRKNKILSARKQAFLTASTPSGTFDTNVKTPRMKKRVGINKSSPYRYPTLENHTDDSKLQYVDTVELDLSTGSRRGSQSDRLTLKSISTIPAIEE